MVLRIVRKEIESPPNIERGFVGPALKRGVDIASASVMLVVLSPVLLGVGFGVKFTSRGSVLFSQERLTKNGRIFRLYKFRSMVCDAESLSGPVLAGRQDPRVTSFGRFLRTTRLDELPQLWNVLVGDMSLIGPRPERPEIAQTLSTQIPGFQRRLGVRAGLTGLAQVIQGYPDGVKGYRRKLGLDRLYIQKQGVLFDLWIIFKTVGVVITGAGAR